MYNLLLDRKAGIYTAEGPCIVCKEVQRVKFTQTQFHKWRAEGHLIQTTMPDLTPGEREFLVSKICEPCFDRITDIEEEGPHLGV